MSKPSTKLLSAPLPQLQQLQRLLVDADVDARLLPYLTAVRFDVLFAPQVDIDIHNDTEILKWARRHRRIYVTHDRFKDGETKYKLYQEVYDNGGQILQIARRRQQPQVMLLGKILVHWRDWVAFFQEEKDGQRLSHSPDTERFRGYYIRARPTQEAATFAPPS